MGLMEMEIIPGLPDGIGIHCLVRVPYRSRNRFRAVSKRWNAVLSSEEFYQERQRVGQCVEGIASLHKFTETFEVVIYHPDLDNWWEILPSIPAQFNLEYTDYYLCAFVKSQQKLVVMGLLDNYYYSVPKVLIFDFRIRKWKLGADVPWPTRYFFAYAASPESGLVYIAGGRREVVAVFNQQPGLREAFAYNVEEDKWYSITPMNPLEQIRCNGTFVDGKFFVVGQCGQGAQVYDPATQIWTTINPIPGVAEYLYSSVAVAPSASASGRLYLFDTDVWGKVIEFDLLRNSTDFVDEFTHGFHHVLSACVWRDSLFLTSTAPLYFGKLIYYLFSPQAKTWKPVKLPPYLQGRCFESSGAAVQI